MTAPNLTELRVGIWDGRRILECPKLRRLHVTALKWGDVEIYPAPSAAFKISGSYGTSFVRGGMLVVKSRESR